MQLTRSTRSTNIKNVQRLVVPVNCWRWSWTVLIWSCSQSSALTYTVDGSYLGLQILVGSRPFWRFRRI